MKNRPTIFDAIDEEKKRRHTLGIASSWLSEARIKRIEKAYPELAGMIQRDSLGGGKHADGCYASNAQSKLRASGEYKLADLLYKAVAEI